MSEKTDELPLLSERQLEAEWHAAQSRAVHNRTALFMEFGSAIERMARAPLLAKLSERDAEIAKLERLVYVPGASRCAKCSFQLQSTFIDANSGRLAANNEPQQCPNGCGPLWKVTERDAGNEMVDRWEKERERAESAERERDELRARLEPPAPTPCVMCGGPVHYRIGAIALEHTCIGSGSLSALIERPRRPE